MKESARHILQILVFVGLVLAVGTAGYLLIEPDITVRNAFYLTVTAITPTQFDEIHELSMAGRYFTVGLVFCGFGAVVAFATQFARWVIQSELEGVGVITRKQMRRRISRMRDHYIVCGYGKIGGAICSELKDQQLPFVVITDDESSVAAIQREGFALVRGNPTADTSLKEAEIDRAHGVIAVLTDDSNNLFISLAARELNPKIFIIARGEDSGVEDRILRAGADIVVSPMKLGGRQIAELIKQQASAASVVSGAAQSSVMGMSLNHYHHSGDTPTTIAAVLQETGAVGAAALQMHDGSLQPTPPPETTVGPADDVVLIMRSTESGDTFHKQPSGKTILLADDHRALRLLFTRKLASAGHNVIQAATGEDALALARAKTPDLVVLDVNMPGRDGYEVCAALRESEQFAGVPIILYSGDDTVEFAHRGRQSGADMCVRKSSRSSELLASIEEVFLQRQQSRARDAGDAASAPGPIDPTSSTRVLDLDLAMDNAGGDDKLFHDMVAVTLRETPPMLDQIDSAIADSDYESLRRTAHSLKSALAVVGANAASDTASRLESVAASDPDWGQAERLHVELRTRYEELQSQLEQHE